jgi:hypothetical protein
MATEKRKRTWRSKPAGRNDVRPCYGLDVAGCSTSSGVENFLGNLYSSLFHVRPSSRARELSQQKRPNPIGTD